MKRSAEEDRLPEQYILSVEEEKVGENIVVALGRQDDDKNEHEPVVVDSGPSTPPNIRNGWSLERNDKVSDEATAHHEPCKASVLPSPKGVPATPKKRAVQIAREKSLSDQITAMGVLHREEELEHQLWREREDAKQAMFNLSDSPTSPPSNLRSILPDSDRLVPSPLPASAPKKSKAQADSFFDKERAAKKRRAKEKEAINQRRRQDEERTEKAIESAMQKEAEANHRLVKPAPHGLGISMNMRMEPERALHPTTEKASPARPSGPFSLNSAAGIAAISKTTDQPATVPRRINLPFEVPTKKTAGSNVFGGRANSGHAPARTTIRREAKQHGRKLVPITAADFALVKWRSDGHSPDEVVQMHKEFTGEDRARSTLIKRYDQVDTALHLPEISETLRETATTGDVAAGEQVNAILEQMDLQEIKAPVSTQRDKQSSGKFAPVVREKAVEVTAIDINLVKWKDQEHTWREVIELYKQMTGHTKSDHVLKKRYKEVSKAIEDERIAPELCEEVIEGRDGALEELNALVRETRSEREQAAATAPLPTHVVGRLTDQPWVKKSRQQNATATETSASQGLASPPYSEGTSSSRTALQPEERRDTGGKMWSDQVFQAYLEHIQESFYNNEDESEDEAEQAREPSPFNEADYCHYKYQIQWRDCTQARADNDGSTVDELIQSLNWLACDVEFDDLDDANVALMSQILLRPRGAQAIATATNDWDISHKKGDNGLKEVEIFSAVGKRQMRVTRFMRSFHDQVMPESKEKWYAKTVYHVHVRTSTRTAEDQFESDEMEREVQQSILRDMSFTTLELANSHAIDEWLRLTFKHTTANLDQRTIERNKAKAAFEDELEQIGENAKFEMKDEIQVGDEGTLKKIWVWVKEGKLAGPRNL